MRVVIQRVSRASVTVGNQLISAVGKGMLVLAGFEHADTEEDLVWMSAKIVNLRIFDDGQGIMNLSVKEISGEILLISQFTLHASTKKGNRPSWIKAAPPDISIPMYNLFVEKVTDQLGKEVKTGIFGADMKVELLNDGPVTILLDSKNKEF